MGRYEATGKGCEMADCRAGLDVVSSLVIRQDDKQYLSKDDRCRYTEPGELISPGAMVETVPVVSCVTNLGPTQT